MAKTLLQAVNEVLKRVNVIAGDANAFTSLVDTAQQHSIDIAVQVINEGIDELYSASHVSLPNEQAESTLVLAATREYTLATNMVTLLWPMIDKNNTQFLWEFPGGYNQMLLLDPEQDDTGLPFWGAINPVTGKFHTDRQPDAPNIGRTYTYQYEKDLSMSIATDTVPFTDVTFRSMVPAWAQLWKREMKGEFDTALYAQAMGRASRYVTELKQRTSYSSRGRIRSITWPWD